MVPPIKLAFAVGNLGKSGSKLAGSTTTSTSEGSGVARTISMDGVAVGGTEDSDDAPAEDSEAGTAAGEPDTTLCEGVTCPIAAAARIELAATIPNRNLKHNLPMAEPHWNSFSTHYLDAAYGRKVVIFLRKTAG